MHIAERMRLMEASGIRKVFDLAATLPSPVNLSIGQPHFDVPEAAKEAAIKAIRDGKNSYTPAAGLPVLKEKVSEWFKRRGIIHDAVIVTAGASGALTLAIMATAEPGDEVLIPDPYFVSYKQLTLAAGAQPVMCSTYPGFMPDPKKLEKLITERTRAIILNSPSNPTGAVYPKEVITAIAKLAEKHGITIISDEVYDCFIYGEEHFSPGTIYPDTITINGLSKSASMTGWRLGFACGPDALINEMTKLQQFTFVSAPQPMQWAALEVLDADASDRRDAYLKKRDLIVAGIKDAYNVTVPGGAFYLFLEVPVKGLSGMDFCVKAVEKNLLVIPGGVFSEQDTHFRISYAAPDETIEQGIRILNELAAQLHSGAA